MAKIFFVLSRLRLLNISYKTFTNGFQLPTQKIVRKREEDRGRGRERERERERESEKESVKMLWAW